jgi:hypothetical protein
MGPIGPIGPVRPVGPIGPIGPVAPIAPISVIVHAENVPEPPVDVAFNDSEEAEKAEIVPSM